AAAPQLAGVAALIKQLAPALPPSGVKYALTSTARDVVLGSCSPVPGLHQGLPAGFGPADATGSGLVDAFAAVVAAYYMDTQLTAASSSVQAFMGPSASASAVARATDAPAYYQGMAD